MTQRGKDQTIPIPDPSVGGRFTLDPPRGEASKERATMYTPDNAGPEDNLATVSRYALRLIDRKTGKAYSIDEMAEEGLLPEIDGEGFLTINGIRIDDRYGFVSVKDPNGTLGGESKLYFTYHQGSGKIPTYLGRFSSAPVPDLETRIGMMYFNTSDNKLHVCTLNLGGFDPVA